MKLSFLLIIPFGLTLGTFSTVEIQFRPNREPIITNVIIRGLEQRYNMSPWNATINIERYRSVELASGDEILIPENGGGIYTSNNFTLCPSIADALISYYIGSRVAEIEIGIGPSSDLVREHQSISVIRHDANNGSLIFGDTARGIFNRSCVPGSISRIQLAGSSEMGLALVNVRFSLGDSSGYVEYLPATGVPVFEINSRQNSFIFSLPSTMAAALMQRITDSGAALVRYHVYEHCNRETLIERLPNIMLTFTDSSTALVFHPEDYIRFNTERNKCFLNFVSTESSMFNFNPLLVTDVNIHITQTEFLICDSQ